MTLRNSLMLALTVGSCLAAAAVSPPALAQPALTTTSDPLNELESGSNSALVFGSGTNTSFGLSAAYSRLLMQAVQGTGVVDFRVTSQTVGSIVSLAVKVGPTINYSLSGSGIRDAFYLRTLGGIAFGSNSTSGTTVSGFDFAYTIEVGKRFELFPSVFWKPAFSMSGTTATGTNPIFSLIPAQFSFFF